MQAGKRFQKPNSNKKSGRNETLKASLSATSEICRSLLTFGESSG